MKKQFDLLCKRSDDLIRKVKKFEKSFLSRTKSNEERVQWNRIRGGIDEIIEFAKSPYLSMKLDLPAILVATPEIVHLPKNMGALANVITTGDGGGLADISAALVAELDRQGLNVHVTLPEYQDLFKDLGRITNREYETLRGSIRDQGRVYPITDDIFKVAQKVYDDKSAGLDQINVRRANAFIRGVISRLFPELKSKYSHILVHCNDWMTGLLPAAAKSQNIHSLMTFHNVFTTHQKASDIREQSIDIRPFYKHLIFNERPGSVYRLYTSMMKADEYVDYMTSGLFAADYINTVSPLFLKEMVSDYFKEHKIMSEYMRGIIKKRYHDLCAVGILNAPASNADPRIDDKILKKYTFELNGDDTISDLKTGKQINKQAFQQQMGLEENLSAPVLFWPSRIARPQKGFELVLMIIPELMRQYQNDKLQIAVVANGELELINQFKNFQDNLSGRISYRPFDRNLSQIGIAGSDFVLMPSLYEPCGTPQVVGQLYGTPPIARKTGGLADTVKHLSSNGIDGSGFVFEDYLPEGLLFGIHEAMKFYRKGEDFRIQVLRRIMKESFEKFNIHNTAKKYIELYEEIFRRAGHKLRVV